MIAALFFRQVFVWRSTQLADALILPPTNHLAQGTSHSRTVLYGSIQSRFLACSAQNASGSLLAVS
jgi:hypothetical protein